MSFPFSPNMLYGGDIKNMFRIAWMFAVLGFIGCAFDVTYDGKMYVSEGSPFNLTCIRSAYGSPKWYKNGVIIDPLNSEFAFSEDNLSPSHVQMTLSVQKAQWKHRGGYKCDSLSDKAHRIEIVPSADTDRKIRTEEKGHQTKVHLEPGQTLELLCAKEEHDAFPINWYKDGQRIQEVEDRIQMEGRILRIFQPNISDIGDYICIFEEKGQSYLYADHQGSRTWVTYGAHVQDFPHQIRPILGRNLSLECKVQGFPTPRIAWFVDGIELHSFMVNESRYSALENEDGMPNAVLFIDDVTYDDNHIVMCIADNVDGFDQTVTELAVRVKKPRSD